MGRIIPVYVCQNYAWIVSLFFFKSGRKMKIWWKSQNNKSFNKFGLFFKSLLSIFLSEIRYSIIFNARSP